MLNNILISRETRKVLSKDNRFIGIEGENLQEILVFNLDEKLDGQGIIEVQFMDKTKGFIELEKTERGYELPVKSSLLTQSGSIEMQLRIIQEGQEIFKSEITTFLINEAINATTTIPEDYPTWIDNLEALKLNLENAEKERVKAEQGRVDAEKARAETFNQMGQAVDNAIGNIVDLQEAYDKNAEDKIKELNDNAGNKLKEHNTNATNKMAEFNENATTQTNAFNQNVQDKTSDFDKNAQDKLDEYNANAEELENRIVELETQIIELETENENIKNQIPVGQAEGENITLNDSSDMEFKELRIGGNIWQETREGYNILQNIVHKDDETYTDNGITYTKNKDGSITANGTATANSNYVLVSENPSQRENISAGNYTISGCPSGGGHNSYKVKIGITGISEYDDLGNGKQFTVSEDNTYYFKVHILSGQTVSNLTFYPMLIRGSIAKPYEQFGQMPSPEFRSEIRNVGDNVNLYDKDNPKVLDVSISSANGIDKEVKGTYKTIYLECEPNTIYTISKKYDETKNRFAVAYTYTEPTAEMAEIYGLTYDNNATEITIKTDEKAKYLAAYLWITGGSTTSQEMLDSIKIEKGSKATKWSPYNCGNFNETVCNGNLFDKSVGFTYGYISSSGTFVEDRSNKNVLFNGYINVEGDKDYTFGCNVSLYRIAISEFKDDKTFIKRTEIISQKHLTITTDVDTKYLRIVIIYGNEETTQEIVDTLDLQLELGSKATEYQPHQSQQFTFPLSEGQRMYIESDLTDNGIEHNRGQTVLGNVDKLSTIESVFGTGPSCLFASYALPNAKSVNRSYNFLSDRISPAHEVFGKYKAYRNGTVLIVLTTLDDTVENVNANIAGSIVEYDLEEPVIEPYTEEQQKVYNEINKAHSYKNVTHIFSTDEIKPIVKTIYRKDLETLDKNKEERLLALENAILGGN